MRIAVFILMYGNHHALHRRIWESLLPRIQGRPEVEGVVVWCSQVHGLTRIMLEDVPKFVSVVHTNENPGKYKVMRCLFEPLIRRTDGPDLIIWFDDDSFITKDDWLPQTLSFYHSKESENICYFGQKWHWAWRPGEWEFIQEQSWYRGKPPDQVTVRGRQVPGVRFATGGFWGLRTDVLRQLDWCPESFHHAGGDTKLAEAVRQLGLPFHHFDYGVAVNQAPRRGIHAPPIGCSPPCG